MVSILNKKSGVLGISGVSSDFRDLEAAAAEGNERAAAGHGRLRSTASRSWIGSYAAAMGGVDAIVFTAGVGENCRDPHVPRSCKGLEFMGVKMDA